MPLGHNTLGKMMSKMSEDAGLSQIYTNHCIRATSATVLHQAGVDPESITYVTGHRSSESLKHYISGPSEEQQRTASSILHQYGDSSNVSSNSDSVPTSSDHNSQIGVSQEHNQPSTSFSSIPRPGDFPTLSSNPSSTSYSATMETQHLVGSLFAGANIGEGCTFNIAINVATKEK